MKSIIPSVAAALALPSNGHTQELLFLGSEYTLANGYIAQTMTIVEVHSKSDAGTAGRVSHAQEMGSFDLNYLANCIETTIYFHAEVNQGTSPSNFVSLAIYPEWTEVVFPDGKQANIGVGIEEPDAQRIADERFKLYLDNGEAQQPTGLLIDGLTNQIIARHPHRLRFIAEALLAKSCLTE